MILLTQLFTVERCQASAPLNAHVSKSLSLDGQMNMLQVSSYTGQNPRTINQERKQTHLHVFREFVSFKEGLPKGGRRGTSYPGPAGAGPPGKLKYA